MIIDQAAYDAMIAHMQEVAPREGVGLLAGPRTMTTSHPQLTADRWVPLRNAADYPRARYEVDPGETLEAWQALDDERRRPWVVVHSHVRTSAAPSETDVRYATDPSLLHMIVSLAGSAPVAALWRLNPNVTAPDHARKVHYQLVDLGFQAIPPTDLTRGVTPG